MINPKDIQNFYSEKIKSEEEMLGIVNNLKKHGKKVGLCIGAFDLLHAGHMVHLKSAKNLCDYLLVGITKEKFVQKMKGKGRPIFNDQLRAYSLSQLECVDFVFVRSESHPEGAIHHIKPDLYVKGSDYKNSNHPDIIKDREAVSVVGGNMKYTSDEKLSTTDIIAYIQNEI